MRNYTDKRQVLNLKAVKLLYSTHQLQKLLMTKAV